MIKGTLRRIEMDDTGTFGVLEIAGETFVTGELPDRGNLPDKSSIPAGTYKLGLEFSPHFNRDMWHIQDVPGRTHVMFHAGNLSGDTDKGYKSDVDGCVLLGSSRGMVYGQPGVTGSQAAVDRFTALMVDPDSEVTIVDEYLEAGSPPQIA